MSGTEDRPGLERSVSLKLQLSVNNERAKFRRQRSDSMINTSVNWFANIFPWGNKEKSHTDDTAEYALLTDSSSS